MAGHILRKWEAERPVDYNDGGHSNLLTKEFSSHHRAAPFSFIYNNKEKRN
jgi:hypothetical protein